MPVNSSSQKYTHVATDVEDGQRPFARRPRPLNYKPTFIKAPVLILFVLVLVCCVVVIEIIFHQSSAPVSAISNHGSSTRSSKVAQVKQVSTTQGTVVSSAAVSAQATASPTISSTAATLATSSSAHTSTAAAIESASVSSTIIATSSLSDPTSSSMAHTISVDSSSTVTMASTKTSSDALLAISSSSTNVIAVTTVVTTISIPTATTDGGATVTTTSAYSALLILSSSSTPSTAPSTAPTVATVSVIDPSTSLTSTNEAYLIISSSSSNLPTVILDAPTSVASTVSTGSASASTYATTSSALLILSSSNNVNAGASSSVANTTPSSATSALLILSSSAEAVSIAPAVTTSTRSDVFTETVTATSALLVLSSSNQVTSTPPSMTASAFIVISSNDQSDLVSASQSAAPTITSTLATSAFLTISSSVPPTSTISIDITPATTLTTIAPDLLTLSSSGTGSLAGSVLSDSTETSAAAATTDLLLLSSSELRVISTATTTGLLALSSADQTVIYTISPQPLVQSSTGSDLPTTNLDEQTASTASLDSTFSLTASLAATTLLTVSSGEVTAMTTASAQNTFPLDTSTSSAEALLTLTSDGQTITVVSTEKSHSSTETPMITLTLTPSGSEQVSYSYMDTTLSSSTDVLALTGSQSYMQTSATAKLSSSSLSSSATSILGSVFFDTGGTNSFSMASSNLVSQTTSLEHNQYSSQPTATITDKLYETNSLSSGSVNPSPSMRYTITTQYTSLIATTDKSGQSTSILAVVVAQTVLSTNPITTATEPAALSSGNHPASATALPSSSLTGSTIITATPWPIATMSATEIVVDGTFTPFRYFAALYLTPIIAIIIKTFWEIVYASFKMMEPFQRLSKPDGASAKRALFKQYLSNTISLDAIMTCFSGLLPLLTTAVYLFVTIVTVLSASSMTVKARGNCLTPSHTYQRCDPAWVINRPTLRFLEALLLICIISTLLIIIFSWRYRSNIASNPSSIASVASMFNQESLIQDFYQMDSLADSAVLASNLRDRRCRLEYHESASGYRYGITQTLTSDLASHKTGPKSNRNPFWYWMRGYTTLANPAASRRKNVTSSSLSIRTQSLLLDIAQLLTMTVLFTLVMAYFFDSKSDPLNNFFNSGSFWARFTYVAIAALLDTQWKRLEREVRITEPYRRMAKGYARPETTVLLSLNGTCWSELPGSIYRLLRFRHMWFQTMVTLVAALSDLNIIAVASIAYSDAQTALMLKTGFYVSVCITGLMIVVMLITMLWWRRGIINEMPRTPDTIGAIFSYLCASQLAQQLGTANLEEWTEEERDEVIIRSGWRFWFGKKVTSDGVERWIVDFEEGTGNLRRKPGMATEIGPSNEVPEMHQLIRSHDETT